MLFPAVLCPGILEGLPLLVFGFISPAALERDDMVYDVSGAGAPYLAG